MYHSLTFKKKNSKEILLKNNSKQINIYYSKMKSYIVQWFNKFPSDPIKDKRGGHYVQLFW